MRVALPMLLPLLAACHSVPVQVSAAPDRGGLRVYFERGEKGSGEHGARLRATGGRLVETVHSPDRSAVSVLWLAPEGRLECAFPYGGTGVWHPGLAASRGAVEYVFLESPGATVTARVPRGCPLLPALRLRIRLAADHLPAALRLPRTRRTVPLRERATQATFRLPVDDAGGLIEGDHRIAIRTRGGAVLSFLVGIDADGTPAATTGYLRNWRGELDWPGHGGR